MTAPLPPVPPGPITSDPGWPRWLNLLRAYVTSGFAPEAGNSSTADFASEAGHATTADSAGTAGTAGFASSAGNVPWAGVTATPTSLSDYGVTAIDSTPISNSPIGLPFAALGRFTQLAVQEGADSAQGTVRLVAGTATVPTTAVAGTTRIFLTAQDDGPSGTPGALRVSAKTATDFTITSTSPTDTTLVAYQIFQQG